MLFIFGKDYMKLFDEVKERASVREVMERAGIVFNRNNMCKCPFHQDKRASMKVKPTDKKFFCYLSICITECSKTSDFFFTGRKL